MEDHLRVRGSPDVQPGKDILKVQYSNARKSVIIEDEVHVLQRYFPQLLFSVLSRPCNHQNSASERKTSQKLNN